MKKISLDEFKSYQFLSSLKTNPCKSAFAFVVAKTDLKNNKYSRNIWLSFNNKIKQLTGLDDGANYIWLNNEEMLIQTTRDANDQALVKEGKELSSFYRININGGEALKAFSLPINVSTIKQIRQDVYAILGKIDANNPDLYKMNEASAKKVYEERNKNKDYEIIDEVPFWFNGTTFINKHRSALFIYDAKRNKLERITDAMVAVGSFDVNQEGTEIVYSFDNYEDYEGLYSFANAYDLKTKKTSALISEEAYMIGDIRYTKDGYGMIATDGLKHGLNQNPSFYKIVSQDKVTKLMDYDNSIGSSVGSDCRLGGGKSLKYLEDSYYFLTTIKDSSHLYSYGEKLEAIVEINGSIDDFEIIGDHIVYIGMQNQKLQELYSYNLKTKKTIQLSKFNEKVLSGKYVAKPEKLAILSNDLTIEGWVLKPIDYDHTKKYPAILDIHGGPKTVYGEVFYHEMQYWANLGYFVFFTNPKGSDGRGNEFMDIRGAYGTTDYENIMDFTDAVLQKYPSIDSSRVAVTGGSYGGFMTNWIVGHTDRFVCAASQRSISNWISFYGVSDIGVRFALDQQKVENLYDGQDKLWWHSPLKYANKVKTPTLFIHSDQDYRCPMEQAMQMFTALRVQKIDTKLVYFKGENHELSRSGKPTHRIKRLEEITAWIQKYTK